eukprot:6190885-Pleurochrysis_carterae.AAC.1
MRSAAATVPAVFFTAFLVARNQRGQDKGILDDLPSVHTERPWLRSCGVSGGTSAVANTARASISLAP